MKKNLIILSFLLLIINAFSFNFLFLGGYALTNASTAENIDTFMATETIDYIYGRFGILFPAEDTPEILYGPYIGVGTYTNNKLTSTPLVIEVDPAYKDYFVEFGLVSVYTLSLPFNLKFKLLAFGGVHTENLFKSFNSTVEINMGIAYKVGNISIQLLSGYITRIFKNNTGKKAIFNFYPLSAGVEVFF